MKLWIDDLRPAPDNTWRVARSVWEAMDIITNFENLLDLGRLEDGAEIEVINLDHDAGDYVDEGGDYINLLNWLEERGACYPVRFHTMNPVGRERMEAVARKNNWPIMR